MKKIPRRRTVYVAKIPSKSIRGSIFCVRSPACCWLGLGFAGVAAAQSVPFPTYQVGENQNGSQGPDYPSTLPNPWVVSDGQIITPAGTQVYLGTTTRAKAIALNPNTSTHTAAVLQMGAPQAVTIFNTQTGAVLQTYTPAAGNAIQTAATLASPIRRMASTCCSARTAIPSMAASNRAASLPSPASIQRRACSQTTPTSRSDGRQRRAAI